MLTNPLACGLVLAALIMWLLVLVESVRLRLVLIAFAAALPAVIALWTVSPRSSAFGDVRLRVEGVEVGAAARLPIRIGGSAAQDDIFVEALPPTAAELRPDGTLIAYATSRPAARLPGQPRPAEAAIVSVSDGPGAPETFLGAHPIDPQDRFCVVDCQAPDATWYRLDEDLTGLEVVGGGPRLPQFRRRPLRRWLGDILSDTVAFYAPAQLIYPVRDYGREWRGSSDSLLDTCSRRFVCDYGMSPVRSFLFRHGGRSGRVHLALLDSAAVLETRDAGGALRRVTASQPARASAAARDEPAQVTIWQVVYGGAETDISSSDRSSRLLRRRIQSVEVGSGGLTARFTVQPTQVISRTDIAQAAERIAHGGLDAPVAVAFTGAQADGQLAEPGNLMHLDGIGGALAKSTSLRGESVASLIFPRGFADDGTSQRLLPELGGALQTQDARGDIRRFSIGTPGEDGRRILLSVDRFSFPEPLPAVLVAWAVLFGFLQAALWRENRTALILTLALQLLLLMRVLVAIGSAGLDPQIGYRAVLGNALIAYCAVPFAMAWLFPSVTPAKLDYAPAGAFLIALAVLLQLSGGASSEMVFAGAAVGAAGMLRPLVLRVLGWTAASARWRPLRRGQARLRSMVRRSTVGPWFRIAAAVAAVRVSLALLFNVNERRGIALSVVYVPLSLITMAGMFEAVRRASTSRAVAAAGWTAAAGALLFLIVPFFANDIGFFFIHAPPVALVAATFVRPGWDWRLKTAAFAPAAVLLILGAWSIGNGLTASAAAPMAVAAAEGNAPTDARALLQRLKQANQTGDDNWRIKAIFDADALNEAGTAPAEQIRRWRFLLANFTADADGRGFPYRAELSDLRRVQADDNLSAIHLMAPFGRHGAAALILMLGVAAFAAMRASSASPGVWRTTALLALCTIFWAAAYMILANLVLVPFTGRNVYLLAALSRSDLVEGAVLFALCFAGLASGRRSAA